MVHQHHVLELDVGVNEPANLQEVQGSSHLQHLLLMTMPDVCERLWWSSTHLQKNGSDITHRHTLPFSLIQEVFQAFVQLLKHEEVMSPGGKAFVEVNDVVVAGAVPPQVAQRIHLAIEESHSGQGTKAQASRAKSIQVFCPPRQEMAFTRQWEGRLPARSENAVGLGPCVLALPPQPPPHLRNC